jgi:4-carboxymuconolactone decarboxylase
MPRRFPPLSAEAMSPAQQAFVDTVVSARGGIGGPYDPLVRVPDLGARVLAVGDAIRFASPLPDRLLELAIITTASHWRARYCWTAHAGLALQHGVSEDTVAALARGDEPTALAPDEQVVHAFSRALVATGAVPDDVFDAAVECVGEEAAVALVSTVGFYSLISFLLNADRSPHPAGQPLPTPDNGR